MKLPFFSKPAAPVAAESKSSTVGGMMVFNPGQPTWTPRDYAGFADEGYTRNVVAFRCVSMIADAMASVPWTAWQGDNELAQSPVLDLLNRPNPHQSGVEYATEWVSYYLIAGNAYEEPIRVGSLTKELYNLRPDRMKVVPMANGDPPTYTYEVNSKARRFEADEIWHSKTFNPTSDFYGMSAIEAAAYAIDQHSEAMKWLKALLENSARPSGALQFTGEGGALSDDSFQRLKAEIEQQYSGSANAGRPIILEGGMSWVAMGASPKDMQASEIKASAARDIALAFGVPPQMLGIPGDNTYSNYQEARLAFWEDTVCPLSELRADDLTFRLGSEYGQTIKPDFDKIPAIADKKNTLWQMADASTDLTINERRALKGYAPLPVGGDELPGQAQSLAGAAFGGDSDVEAEAMSKALRLAYGAPSSK